MFMFVHLTNRTKILVHVRSFIKRTNINELPAEQFTNCSLGSFTTLLLSDCNMAQFATKE
ncbi:hypothetical protein Hanom_Chr12g01108081 [Helianthus anomalus]